MARSLSAKLIQNVPPAAKLITQQKNVGVVPVPTFVQNGIERTPMIRSPPKTKTPAPKPRNPQRPHQANRHPRSLNQKTNFATTPSLRPNVDTTICHIRPS